MLFQPANSTFTFQSKTKGKKRNEKKLKSSKSKIERSEEAQGELIASVTTVTTSHVDAEKKVFSAITSEFFINVISHSHSGNSPVEGDSAAVLLKSILNRTSAGAGGVASASNNISLFTCGAIILSSLNACVVATSWNDLVIYSLSTDASLSTTATAAQERASFKLGQSEDANNFIVKMFLMQENKLLLLYRSGLIQVKQIVATSSDHDSNLKLVDIHSYTSSFSQYMILHQELVPVIPDDKEEEEVHTLFTLKQIIYDQEKKCCLSHDLIVPTATSSSFVSTVTPLVLPDGASTTLAAKPIVAGKILSSSSNNGRNSFYIVDQEGRLTFMTAKNDKLPRQQNAKRLPGPLDIMEFVDMAMIQNISACCTSNGTVVIVSQKQAKTFLTAWDSVYGTLQGRYELFDGAQLDTPDLSSTRVFSLLPAPSNDGTFSSLLLHITSTSSDSKYSHFTFQVIPFTAPSRITLLSALGRGSSTRKAGTQSIIPISPPPTPILPSGGGRKPLKAWSKRVDAWQEMDMSFLEKLLDPTQTPTIDLFTSTFIQWICAQNAMIRAWPSPKSPSGVVTKISMPKKVPKSLLYLPPLLLNHQGIQQILDRCTLSSLSFWPASVVEYLLAREKVVSTFSASSSCSVYSDTLLTVLLQMKEYGLVNKGIEALGVGQVFLLIDWATTMLAPGNEDENGVSKSKEEEENDDQVAKTQAGDILLHSLTCFVAKNYSAHHLKDLSRMQVFVILDWVRGILDPSLEGGKEKSPLWWAWSMPPKNSFQNAGTPATLDQIAYEKWMTAIDAFSLIIDSHISLLRLDPALKSLTTNLSENVKRDSFLFTLFNKKLRGPLQACVSPEAIEAFKAKQEGGRGGGSRFGKEWRKMVHQMEIGVGEYAVEVVEMRAF